MSESIVITGEASVRVASAFSLRRSLKLEIEHGMKKRGRAGRHYRERADRLHIAEQADSVRGTQHLHHGRTRRGIRRSAQARQVLTLAVEPIPVIGSRGERPEL